MSNRGKGAAKAILARIKVAERTKPGAREGYEKARNRPSVPATGPTATVTRSAGPAPTTAPQTSATGKPVPATETPSARSSATSSNPDTSKPVPPAAPPTPPRATDDTTGAAIQTPSGTTTTTTAGTKGRSPWSGAPIKTTDSAKPPASSPDLWLRTTRRGEWSVRSPTTAVRRTPLTPAIPLSPTRATGRAPSARATGAQSFTAAAQQIADSTVRPVASSTTPASSLTSESSIRSNTASSTLPPIGSDGRAPKGTPLGGTASSSTPSGGRRGHSNSSKTPLPWQNAPPGDRSTRPSKTPPLPLIGLRSIFRPRGSNKAAQAHNSEPRATQGCGPLVPTKVAGRAAPASGVGAAGGGTGVRVNAGRLESGIIDPEKSRYYTAYTSKRARDRAAFEFTYWTGDVCDDDVDDIRKRIWEFEKQPVVDNWPRVARVRVDQMVSCKTRKTKREPLFRKLYPRW